MAESEFLLFLVWLQPPRVQIHVRRRQPPYLADLHNQSNLLQVSGADHLRSPVGRILDYTPVFSTLLRSETLLVCFLHMPSPSIIQRKLPTRDACVSAQPQDGVVEISHQARLPMKGAAATCSV